jgi:DNA repair protein RadC
MAFFLNTASQLIGYRLINTGTMDNCLIDIRLLVSIALHCMASNVIIAHNHPSGNLQISKSDEKITKQVFDALKLIDVKLLDHLIISENSYLSLREEGLL